MGPECDAPRDPETQNIRELMNFLDSQIGETGKILQEIYELATRIGGTPLEPTTAGCHVRPDRDRMGENIIADIRCAQNKANDVSEDARRVLRLLLRFL